MRIVTAVVFGFSVVHLSIGFGQLTQLPRFQDYRVSSIYRGAVKTPDFGALNQYSGTDLRCFGAAPASYTNHPANFAGHFVIGTCACGSGCRYLFMWDALSGKVYLQFPFGAINLGPYGIGAIVPPIEYKGEQYRLDSALLIVEGCTEGTCDCAKSFYAWDGRRFKLLLRQPLRVPPDCAK